MTRRSLIPPAPFPQKRPRRQETGGRAYRLGLWAERFCLLSLRLKGYRLVARRVRTPFGEIDLIVTRGEALVLVEVKARDSLTAAAEALGPAQRQRLVRAAGFIMARYPAYQNKTLRFDFMLVARWRWPVHLPNAWDGSL